MLELACGTGQLLIPIAGLGLRTVGLDIHPAMLSAATDRAQSANVNVCVSDPLPPSAALPPGRGREQTGLQIPSPFQGGEPPKAAGGQKHHSCAS